MMITDLFRLNESIFYMLVQNGPIGLERVNRLSIILSIGIQILESSIDKNMVSFYLQICVYLCLVSLFCLDIFYNVRCLSSQTNWQCNNAIYIYYSWRMRGSCKKLSLLVMITFKSHPQLHSNLQYPSFFFNRFLSTILMSQFTTWSWSAPYRILTITSFVTQQQRSRHSFVSFIERCQFLNFQ